MTTPILGLSEIAEGVASQAALHNTALREFEARSIRVLSRTTTAPPGSPAEGDSYIIPVSATGVWTGKTNQIAAWIGGAWSYYVPVEGVIVWINDTNNTYAYDGAAWVLNSGAGSGTVTSVAMTVPAHLSISGSPITTSGTLAVTLSGTALPVANGGTGITSFGTGVATFLGTPSSANLAAALTDETGTGAAVFATSPTLVTPVLGTPTSGTLTNCVGLPVAGGGTGVATLAVYAPIFGGTTGTGAVQSGTAGTSGQVLTSNGAGVLPTFQAVGIGGTTKRIAAPAWAASMALDWGSYDVYRITAGGATTTFTFSGGTDGQNCMIEFLQDATGGRLITWPATARFSVDLPSPTLTTAASKMDRIGFQANIGLTKYDCVAVVKGY